MQGASMYLFIIIRSLFEDIPRKDHDILKICWEDFPNLRKNSLN